MTLMFWFERLWQDVRQAARMFRKAPGFTAIAILSIACGTGANVAIFSVADTLLLRPAPVPRPHELLIVGAPDTDGVNHPPVLSYPDYQDLRAQSRTVDGMLAYLLRRVTIVTAPGSTPHVRIISLVTANYFDVLRVAPALGRGFVAADDRAGADSPPVVLSHGMWQHNYGADPQVLGHRVRIGGLDFTIVGVAPESFTGLEAVDFPDSVFIPLAMAPRMGDAAIEHVLTDRRSRLLTVRTRLAPGVGIDAARTEIATIGQRLAASYPAEDKGRAIALQTQIESRFASNPLDVGLITIVSLLSVAVLAVACANVAGLLASRAPLRAREIALKLAIGAGRARLIRQLITESVMLAVGGGVVGLLFARAGIILLRRIEFPSEIVQAPALHLDARALTFNLVVAVTSAFLFGIWPAVHTTRVDLLAASRGSEDKPSRWRLTPRGHLVAVQVALSLALITIVTFSFQIFRGIVTTGPGFRTTQIAQVNVDTERRRYNDDQAVAFFERVVRDTRALPGVTQVTAASALPFWMADFMPLTPEGYRSPDAEAPSHPVVNSIEENYFATMDVPIVRGRGFTERDTADAPPVAIVNETIAQRFWPDRDPIGARFRLGGESSPLIEIVGVARTTKYLYVIEPAQDAIFVPFRQLPRGAMVVLARTDGSSTSLVGPLRQVVRTLDPDTPTYDAQTMESFYAARAVGMITTVMELIFGIGSMGMALTMVGLYGLVSFAVSRRTREIGIRMAIGASAADVLTLFLRQGLRPAWIGLPAGLILSLVAIKLLPALVPTNPFDIRLFVLVLPALVALIVIAALIPARRAARVNPMVALRYE